MNFIYKKWLPSAINGLFLFFISITLIGAFRSDNLKISTLTNHFFFDTVNSNTCDSSTSF